MKKLLIALVAAMALVVPGLRAANPLDILSGVVSAVTSSDKFEIKDLEGTWEYKSPAVTFKSDDALSKAGGVAASAAAEAKLAPYYSRLGLNSVVITFDAEGNFTIKAKKFTLSGTAVKDSDSGLLTLKFQTSGKINLGHISAIASKDAVGVLTLTLDATRVIAIVDKVASIANNQTLKTMSQLLDKYDGIYAGAKFKRKK